MTRRIDRGFTLIEMMVALAVVAILVAIAYPSYIEYIKRERRTGAQLILVEAAGYMERFYGSNHTYEKVSLPASMRQYPRQGAAAYEISVRAESHAYALTASPTGVMSHDACGALTLHHTGAYEVVGPSLPWSRCWR